MLHYKDNSLPPLAGAGLVQVLVQNCSPLPQVAKQAPFAEKSDQPPFTEYYNLFIKGGVQPKFFRKLDFELAVGPSGPTYGQTFPGVFEIPDPPAPAWCHAQIWPPEIVGFENCSKPGLWVLYG